MFTVLAARVVPRVSRSSVKHVHATRVLRITTQLTQRAFSSHALPRKPAPFARRSYAFMRSSPRVIIPPSAPRKPELFTFGSASWEDAYRWLQDPENPETKKYIRAENEYATQSMLSTVAVQKELYKEMKSRMFATEDTVPEKYGEYWYYTRLGEKDEFSIYCRKRGSMDNPEEILVNQNELAKHKKFIHVNILKLNDAHTMLAYTMDSEGLEEYGAYIKNLATGELLEDTIFPVVSVEWGTDDNILYYTTPDDKLRPYQLYKHVIGTPTSSDVLLFEEKDDRFFLDLSKTKDGKFVTLNSNSKTTSEVHLIENEKLRLVHKRVDNIECFVEHYGDEFLITTNAGDAPNLRVLRVSDKDPQEKNWVEFVPEDPESKLEDLDVVKVFKKTHRE